MLTRSAAGFRAARVAVDTAARFRVSGDSATARRWQRYAEAATASALADREANR